MISVVSVCLCAHMSTHEYVLKERKNFQPLFEDQPGNGHTTVSNL